MIDEDKTSQSSHSYGTNVEQPSNNEHDLYGVRKKIIKPITPGIDVENAGPSSSVNNLISSSNIRVNAIKTRDLKQDKSNIYPENTRERYNPEDNGGPILRMLQRKHVYLQ